MTQFPVTNTTKWIKGAWHLVLDKGLWLTAANGRGQSSVQKVNFDFCFKSNFHPAKKHSLWFRSHFSSIFDIVHKDLIYLHIVVCRKRSWPAAMAALPSTELWWLRFFAIQKSLTGEKAVSSPFFTPSNSPLCLCSNARLEINEIQFFTWLKNAQNFLNWFHSQSAVDLISPFKF